MELAPSNRSGSVERVSHEAFLEDLPAPAQEATWAGGLRVAGALRL
jgi:hypothetical protein